MKILFAASEIFPYAKTGGLGDVAQALPRTLGKSVDIVCVMPMYGFMNNLSFEKSELNFSITLGGNIHRITLYTASNKGIKTYFISTPQLSGTQNFYSVNSGAYDNDTPNFGIFCAAVAELAKILTVDILHLNDWHTALAALWIKESAPHIKTVFTIHNLAYQGVFDAQMMERFGIDKKYFTMKGIEYYGKVNFMKAGIAYSDAITTVSPQYAKEIMTEMFGCGLHNFLLYHSDRLSGILNGIDCEIFDPSADEALSQTFNPESIDLKYINKQELVKKLALKDTDRPLFIMISRLVEQKGFDLLLENLQLILNMGLNLIVLADGNNMYKSKLEYFAKSNDNFHLSFGYEEQYAHSLYGAGDFLLMPSLYEPCGLNQLIAMRYGVIPVVHGVGGLLDTVHENDEECGVGIVFKEYTGKSFIDAVDRALALKKESKKINKMISHNMKCDFSFNNSAKLYVELYKKILS